MNVLIVEDAPSVAETLKTLVTMCGHHAVVAPSAGYALEAAGALEVDFVLLDINLPGMDGYELAGRLRSSYLRPEVPIIAVTSLKDDGASRMRFGIDGYLGKPISIKALKAALHQSYAH